MKHVSINSSVILNNKWTPKFACVYSMINKANAKPLEDFLSISPTNGIDAREFEQDGIAYVRVSDIKRYFISYSSIKKVKKDIPAKIRLHENDILISRKGSPGIAVIVNSNDCGNLISSEAILTRIKPDYSPYYFIAFFNTKFFFSQVISNLSGSVATGINHPTLKKLKVIYDSSLAKSIGEMMGNAIKLHALSQNLIIQAQQLFYTRIHFNFNDIVKESTFSVNKCNFVNQDLWTPKYSYPLFVNTLKAIQKEWRTVPIGEIADLKKGVEVGSDAYIGYLDKRKSDVPFVRTSDIVNYEIDQYPDFFVPEEIYNELGQGFQNGDVLFTKDGKIGMVGMVTEFDKAIISSGFVGLRLKKKAVEYGITPEYLFLALSIKEIGIYASKRRTVVASTIPHLKEERLKEIEIPIIDKDSISEITDLVKKAFELKGEKKRLITEVRETMDSYFSI